MVPHAQMIYALSYIRSCHTDPAAPFCFCLFVFSFVCVCFGFFFLGGGGCSVLFCFRNFEYHLYISWLCSLDIDARVVLSQHLDKLWPEKWSPYSDGCFEWIFLIDMIWSCFKFHRGLFLGSNWQYVTIGSGYGLAPNRRQAITWTNLDKDHRLQCLN